MGARLDTRVFEIFDRRFIVCVDLLGILRLSYEAREFLVYSIL